MSRPRVSRRLAPISMLALLSALLMGFSPTGADSSSTDSVTGPQTARVWFGWTSLGKPTGVSNVYYPVVGQNQNGFLEVFVQGSATSSTDYTVYHIWQKPSDGSWSNWDRLGATEALAAPSVVQNHDGRLEVFAQKLWIGFGGQYPGPHYEASHIYQTAVNGPWGSWSSLGQPSNGGLVELWEPYSGRNQDGRLAIFAKGQGTDGNIWTKSQTGAGVDNWSAWASLSKPAGVDLSPVLSVGQQQDGRLEIFTYGTNNEVYHNWQTLPNGGWSGWGSFGRPPGVNVYHPAVGRNQDGRLEFFTSGSDGNMWHKWQVAPNSYWSGWGSLGQPSGINLGDPVVGHYNTGVMNVFARGSDSGIWSISQTAPNGGWGTWQSLGKPSGVNLTDQIAVGRTLLGYLVLFAVGDDGALWVNNEGWIIISCYNLTLSVNPGGSGSVSPDPAPNCASGTTYLVGTNVKLTAAPNSGYSFGHWSGDASGGVNPTTIAMDADKSVTANFVATTTKSRHFLPIILR